MNIRVFCKHALDDIHNLSSKDRNQQFLEIVQRRLDKSFDSYNHDVTVSVDYLKRRNELTVIRKMNRLL